MTELRNPPFVVDYTIDGRQFSVLLLGPTSWADAEAHLAAIGATGVVEGSDVETIPARAIDLWALAADTLLTAATAAGRDEGRIRSGLAELAIAGAAVMTAAGLASGLDRRAARRVALAMVDDVYRAEDAA